MENSDLSFIDAFDRKHIDQVTFEELYNKNVMLGNKLMSFVTYLRNSPHKGQRYKLKDSAT